MKIKCVLSIFLITSISGFSQNTYSIKGSLVDSSSISLPFSSVFLLLPSDSSLVTFTRADENGNFAFLHF